MRRFFRAGVLNAVAAGIYLATNEARKFANLALLMIRDPKEFARVNIGGRSKQRSTRAVQFFLAVFVLTFALQVFGNRIFFVEGTSEIRETIRPFLQMLIAIPLIYVLLVLLRHKATFVGVLQVALYVDAVYLFTVMLLALPLQYADYLLHYSPAEQVVDIFSTELERCLTQSSLTYWLIRGDLQFYLHNDQWRPWGYIRFAIDNLHYVLALPFALLYAVIFQAKFGGRLLVTALIVGLCSTAVFVGLTKAELWLLDNRAASAPQCYSKPVTDILKKYSKDLIASQVEYKLNNALSTATGSARNQYAYKSDHFLYQGTMSRRIFEANFKSPEDVKTMVRGAFKTLYCSDERYWMAMRSMNLPLVVAIHLEGEKDPVFFGQYSVLDCSKR